MANRPLPEYQQLMTASQRGMAAAELSHRSPHGGHHKARKGPTMGLAAGMWNVSIGTVKAARRVLASGNEYLINAVKDGTMSVGKALDELAKQGRIYKKPTRKSDSRILREWLLHLVNGRCPMCETAITVETMARDHIIPLDAFGEDEWFNMQATCRPCNRKKSNKFVPRHQRYQGHKIPDDYSAAD